MHVNWEWQTNLGFVNACSYILCFLCMWRPLSHRCWCMYVAVLSSRQMGGESRDADGNNVSTNIQTEYSSFHRSTNDLVWTEWLGLNRMENIWESLRTAMVGPDRIRKDFQTEVCGLKTIGKSLKSFRTAVAGTEFGKIWKPRGVVWTELEHLEKFSKTARVGLDGI